MTTTEATLAALERKPRRGRTTLLSATFLIPGLAISGWSLFGYLRTAGAPIWLAVGASASVDGLGLFAAVKAHEFAAVNRPAKFAQILTWVMVCGSVLINWQHASTQHWNLGLHVLISLPAAAAAAAFELIMQEIRGEVREKSEPRKRTRRSVKIDADIWLHHPFMVWGARRKESAERLRTALAAGTVQLEQPAPPATIEPEPEPESVPELSPANLPDPSDADLLLSCEPPAWSGMTTQAAIERASTILPNRSASEIVAALGKVGITTTDNYVRTARKRIREQQAQQYARELERQSLNLSPDEETS
jgi:Protein of unknown function (DUF2637)